MDILKDIWGDIPGVAGFQDVDLQQEQLDAIMGNIENWPQIEKLGDLYQQYMIGGYGGAGLENFTDIVGLGGKTTEQTLRQASELLTGEIPKDVQDQIRRSTAYQSLRGGTAGSPMAGALTARDLGRTSLDMLTQGANLAGAGGNAAQQWQNIASGTVMSPSGWVITPAQQAEMTMSNRLIQRQIEQQRLNMEAMPDPASRGIHDAAFSLIQAYAGMGGMGGGGGGAPGSSTNPSGGSYGGAPGTQAGAMSYYNPSFNYGQPGAAWGGGGGGFGGGGAGSSWNMSAAQPMQFNQTQVAPWIY